MSEEEEGEEEDYLSPAFLERIEKQQEAQDKKKNSHFTPSELKKISLSYLN